MFFARFKKLCDDRGISTYKACTDIGLNRSAVAKWKNGGCPNGSTAAKLADYFGVTTDYLLGQDTRPLLELPPRFPPHISKAREEMLDAVSREPAMPFSERLSFLVDACDLGFDEFCRELGIAPEIVLTWLNGGYPRKEYLDKFLSFFKFRPQDIFNLNDQTVYKRIKYRERRYLEKEAAGMHFPESSAEIDALYSGAVQIICANRPNKIKLAGRDGSYEERILTDDQMEALKSFLKLLPDASKDL